MRKIWYHDITRHVFVKQGCPGWQQNQNMAKFEEIESLSPIFWPQPQGCVMSVKFEEPLDELTVQVRLLYHHPYFKYRTSFVSRTELLTDKRMDLNLKFKIISLGRGTIRIYMHDQILHVYLYWENKQRPWWGPCKNDLF